MASKIYYMYKSENLCESKSKASPAAPEIPNFKFLIINWVINYKSQSILTKNSKKEKLFMHAHKPYLTHQ